MSPKTLNIILDIVLILASVWMVYSIRNLGGIVGQGLTLVTIGALVLGVAHLGATLLDPVIGTYSGTVHRSIVLIGFVLVVFGFRRITSVTS